MYDNFQGRGFERCAATSSGHNSNSTYISSFYFLFLFSEILLFLSFP